MAGGLTLKVKSPHEAVYVKNYKSEKGGRRIGNDLREAMDVTMGEFLVDKIKDSIAEANIMNWRVIATFFQRVVARTPIDEDYWVKYSSGGSKNHKRDENSCKLDWYIQIGRKKIYVDEIIQSNGNVFEKYNDKQSIQTLEVYFSSVFGDTKFGNITANIGNDNPHFAVLEYGGIKGKPNKETRGINNPPDLLSEEEGQLHRMKNGRSIQAPYGMLRITEAELDSIVLAAKRGKYNKGGMGITSFSKKPSRETAMKIIKTLKKSGKIPLSELKDLDFRKLK